MESEAGMSDPIDRASLVARLERLTQDNKFAWMAVEVEFLRALLLGLQAPPAYLAVDSTTVTAGNLPDRAGNVNEFTRTLVGQAPDWQSVRELCIRYAPHGVVPIAELAKTLPPALPVEGFAGLPVSQQGFAGRPESST
jgi:hypothetical protein